MRISKTSRILFVFHLFLHCEDVAYKEITDFIDVSEKTIYRDICLLRQGGVIRPRFSKKRNAFVLQQGEPESPKFPESKSQKLYLEKIIRLCQLMRNLPEADPDVWYHAHYPTLSLRTRQRDFAALANIGYFIVYNRENGYRRERNRYYCVFPEDAYDLELFD